MMPVTLCVAASRGEWTRDHTSLTLMTFPSIAITLALILLTHPGARADEFDIPPQEIEVFARQFQAALSQRDAQRVVTLVKFPLRVNVERSKPRRLSRAQLLQDFDAVFPQRVVDEVLTQDPTQLFHNYQGVMFGNGVVWADEFCGEKRRPDCPVLITTVNLPGR